MTSLWIILFLSWSSPWNGAPEATAPWISQEREDQRISFFNGLNQFDGLNKTVSEKWPNELSAQKRPEAVTEDLAVERGDESEGDHELREIPWAAHRTLYPSLSRHGLWQWPVEKARVVSGFGLRSGRPHEGLDLKAGYASRVMSAAAGRVVFVGSLKGYGKTIVVYHGSGWSTIYAHLSVTQTLRGRVIERGDTVGLSGDSGKASGPHLHFEVRREGRPVNPLSLSFSESPYLASRR